MTMETRPRGDRIVNTYQNIHRRSFRFKAKSDYCKCVLKYVPYSAISPYLPLEVEVEVFVLIKSHFESRIYWC